MHQGVIEILVAQLTTPWKITALCKITYVAILWLSTTALMPFVCFLWRNAAGHLDLDSILFHLKTEDTHLANDGTLHEHLSVTLYFKHVCAL